MAKMMAQIVCCPCNSRFAHLAAILIDVTFVAFSLCLLKRKSDVSIKTDGKKTEVNVKSMMAARCTIKEFVTIIYFFQDGLEYIFYIIFRVCNFMELKYFLPLSGAHLGFLCLDQNF